MSNVQPIIHHGIVQLAENSFISNCEIEALPVDPTIMRIGRIWFNSSAKVFKYSGLDINNNIIVCEFANNVELSNFIANIQSTNGSTLIGFDGNITNPNLIVPADTLKNTLDLMINEISHIKSSIGGSILITNDEFTILNLIPKVNDLILSKSVLDKNSMVVIINGMVQSEFEYNILNLNTLHFNNDLSDNDVVKVIMFGV